MHSLLESMRGGRRFAALLLSLGIVQIAGYWLAGSLVNGPGPLAVPQPDTLLYCQAAARIAEGHPFSFSHGSAMCTGTTSVLYPFILAVPYMLGFKGASLVSAGFWLNALLYLVFLSGWGFFFWRRFSNPCVRLLGCVLLALFPQTAYCAMAQSDIGLWLAASGLLAASLASDRAWAMALTMAFVPWVRPEGMICVCAFVLVTLLGFRNRRWNDWSVGLVGLASIAGVFALNFWITGHLQFSSVSNKGYFLTEPFGVAVQKTAADAIEIVRSIVLGQPISPPRTFYAIPFLSAAFLWVGVLVHDWRHRSVRHDFTLLVAAFGSVICVAQSGWQNSNMDRYMAWIVPLCVMFSAEGMYWGYDRLKGISSAACLICLLPIAFSIAMGLVFMALFHACSSKSERLPMFARDMDRILPQNSSFGCIGSCGLTYFLSQRRCAHLVGIYSPEFRGKNLLENLEILKNEPATRFDYWFMAPDDMYPDGLKTAQGRQIAVGPDGYEVNLANWKPFDAGLSPKADIPSGKQLVCKLDVGYDRDERKYRYEVVPRYLLNPYPALGMVAKCGDEKMFDTGRVVFGEDEMTVPLKPGVDVTMVMRTMKKVKFVAPSEFERVTATHEYSSPLELHVEIDGVEVGHAHAKISAEGFTDAVFTIPGKAITNSPCRVSLHGDHVSFGYWFYQ